MLSKSSYQLCCFALCLLTICCAPTSRQAGSSGNAPKAMSLDKSMQLTVDVKKPESGTVPADAGQRSIERGLEVSLTFENTGKEPVQTRILAGIKPEGSEVTLIDHDNKAVAPMAMKFEGNELGYRTVNTPGGIAIAGCQDNPPVAVNEKDGSQAGVISLFCTKPGEKDTLVVMFPKPTTLNEVTIKIKCELCPKDGLTVKSDLAKL
jgi:hypothetical protein